VAVVGGVDKSMLSVKSTPVCFMQMITLNISYWWIFSFCPFCPGRCSWCILFEAECSVVYLYKFLVWLRCTIPKAR